MSCLLDADTCSRYMRRPGGLFHRFIQHAGRLCISSVGLSELYTWAYKQDDPSTILQQIRVFLKDLKVLAFDEACAEQVGRLRGSFLRQGIAVGAVDLMIAATAMVNNLTLVSHNTKDFERIPGLRLEDWLSP